MVGLFPSKEQGVSDSSLRTANRAATMDNYPQVAYHHIIERSRCPFMTVSRGSWAERGILMTQDSENPERQQTGKRGIAISNKILLFSILNI